MILLFLEVLKSKIHRATVTDAKLDYIGSITIDMNLIEMANLLEYEKVLVANLNTGQRFETYVISGERGSGVVCLNGAAARLAQVGDIIIILAFGYFEPNELVDFTPKTVFVDQNNQIVKGNIL